MSERKVHFSEPIHRIEYLDKQWDTASRLARDGSDWIRMVADRQRFRDRIERTAEILNKILDFDFRQEVYRKRFKNFVAPEELEQQELKIEESTNTATQLFEPSLVSEEAYKQQIESNSSQPQPKQQKQRPQLNSRQRRKRRNNSRRKHRGRHRKN